LASYGFIDCQTEVCGILWLLELFGSSVMFGQGERREMRKETSQHAVSRTNQSAMERGESSISIGYSVMIGTSSTQNVPILGGFGRDDPEIGK